MYYAEKITPKIVRELQAGEDRREYKTGPDNRIVLARDCQHCGSQYFPRRKNHKYCSNSCRVMACYARNNYKYQSGRYVKNNNAKLPAKQSKTKRTLEDTNEPNNTGFDWQQFQSSALGSASVETLKYLAHDRQLMKKIDQIHAMLGGMQLPNKIQYLGVQMNGTRPVSLFRDAQGYTLANDIYGRWYQLLSNNPVKWVTIANPME